MDRFTILHDVNGIYIDYSLDAEKFTVDDFMLPLVESTDHLYVGLYKPFGFCWIEFSVLNTVESTTKGEYWNGVSWVDLDKFIDRTKGFIKSQKLEWNNEQSDWADTQVNGETLYWVRFKPGADLSPETKVNGVGIVFADDDDLSEEVNHINKHLPSGKLSFIQYHQSVVRDMVTQVNNRGRKKLSSGNQGMSNITKFDFLNTDELVDAAKYKALEKIYFSVSDNTEDKYYQKYLDFKSFGTDAFDLYYLSIDFNDDGIESTAEANKIERVVIRVL